MDNKSQLTILSKKIERIRGNLAMWFRSVQVAVDRPNYLFVNVTAKLFKKHMGTKFIIDNIYEEMGLEYTEEDILNMVTTLKMQDEKGHWFIADFNEQSCCFKCYNQLLKAQGRWYTPEDTFTEDEWLQWELDMHNVTQKILDKPVNINLSN